ncbi:hypothetical protein D8S78_03300 [Natrialba swarupiae]|nr:hypothetical protein [Natrialba swarupiae]
MDEPLYRHKERDQQDVVPGEQSNVRETATSRRKTARRRVRRTFSSSSIRRPSVVTIGWTLLATTAPSNRMSRRRGESERTRRGRRRGPRERFESRRRATDTSTSLLTSRESLTFVCQSFAFLLFHTAISFEHLIR